MNDIRLIIFRALSNPISACAAVFLVSVSSLMMALTAQYVFGLEPCVLCIYQRWPYVIAATLGIVGLGTLYKEEWSKLAAATVFFAGVAFFAGGAIAFYHVGVEQHWWVSAVEGCAADFSAADISELKAMLDNKPAVRCDQPAWIDPFFGISMAGYNMAFSFALSFMAVLSSVLMARRANGMLA